MSEFTSRFERLELKFLIDELDVPRIRRQIRPFCVADRYSRGARERGGCGYPISSLYLDTPALAFHEAKERGDPDRLKLRVRTYSPTSPATLEVKRRRSNVIDKTRAVVDRELTERVVGGELRRAEASGHDVLADFSRIVALSGAHPTLTIRYDREAYESVVDHYARVTFDRRVAAARTAHWNLQPDPRDWCRFDEHWSTQHATSPVVMEVKCQVSIPAWVIDLIRSNELVQTSFSKYSVGIHVTRWNEGRPRVASRSAKALSAA